jgi:type IV pilus assembly protein PilY1
LFTDPAGQAITTKPMVGSGPVSSFPRAMIDFGTGLKTPLTNTAPASFSSGTHALYGIWDWNMSTWNAKSTARFASLNSRPTTATLRQQQLLLNARGDLDGTTNTVCWADQSNCASAPNSGWYITLGHPGEQVIFNPVIYQNALLINTTIPADNQPFSCKNNGDGGYTIAVALDTGAAIPGLFPQYGDTLAAGSLTNNSGSPFVVLAGGQAFMLTQTVGGGKVDGTLSCQKGSGVCEGPIKPQGPVGKRLTWIQRR